MKILAVDTSSKYGVVGLSEDGLPVAEISCRSHETHSARLLASIDMLLELTKWKLDEIDVFGIVIGPGSFTGLRVGLATIKGLAWSKKKPVVSLNSLEILAWGVVGSKQLLCPMMDARKGRVYGAIYQYENGQLKTIKEPADIEPLLLVESTHEPLLCFGDGSRLYRKSLSSIPHVSFAPENYDMPRGAVCSRISFETYSKGKISDVTTLEPIYLSLSAAELAQGLK